mmetsp:Transcript_20828/g.69898  ORF Transcript_20828/g.69898 Transcript_20828/m.69898 type:complete len:241 (+) Transcript_20828:468-1190(+)
MPTGGPTAGASSPRTCGTCSTAWDSPTARSSRSCAAGTCTGAAIRRGRASRGPGWRSPGISPTSTPRTWWATSGSSSPTRTRGSTRSARQSCVRPRACASMSTRSRRARCRPPTRPSTRRAGTPWLAPSTSTAARSPTQSRPSRGSPPRGPCWTSWPSRCLARRSAACSTAAGGCPSSAPKGSLSWNGPGTCPWPLAPSKWAADPCPGRTPRRTRPRARPPRGCPSCPRASASPSRNSRL